MTWGGLKRNPLKDWNVPSSNYRHICYVRLNGCNVHIKWESQVHLIYDPPPTQPDPQKKKHKNSSLQKRLLKRKNGFKEILQSTLFSAENNFSLFTGHYVLSNLSFGPTFHKNWTGHNLLTDNTLKKITQDVLVTCLVIVCDHNVKLAGHFQNLVGQRPVTSCCFQHCFCKKETSKNFTCAVNWEISNINSCVVHWWLSCYFFLWLLL